MGAARNMSEVGAINGGGPGAKLLGARTSIGGVQIINGGVGAPKSMSGAQLFGRAGYRPAGDRGDAGTAS